MRPATSIVEVVETGIKPLEISHRDIFHHRSVARRLFSCLCHDNNGKSRPGRCVVLRVIPYKKRDISSKTIDAAISDHRPRRSEALQQWEFIDGACGIVPTAGIVPVKSFGKTGTVCTTVLPVSVCYTQQCRCPVFSRYCWLAYAGTIGRPPPCHYCLGVWPWMR